MSHQPGRLSLSEEMHGDALRMAGLAPPKRVSTDPTDSGPTKKARNGATVAAKPRGYQGAGYRSAAYGTFGRDQSPIGNRDPGVSSRFQLALPSRSASETETSCSSRLELVLREERRSTSLRWVPSGKETQTLTPAGKPKEQKTRDSKRRG